MSYKLNVLGPPFDIVNAGVDTSNTIIPQYNSDPVSPNLQSAWVLKTGGGGGTVTGGGKLFGILGLSTYLITAGVSSGGTLATYKFSYRTLEGTTKRITIS